LIGAHVSCSICYLDSLRATYCFLRLGKLFFYYSSGRFRYSPPCPALPAAILASFHSPCYSCSHPIRLRRCGAWVAHLWFRRACVYFCCCGVFFEVNIYGSTFGGGSASILVVSVIDYGVCVSQSGSLVIDLHHRNFPWSSSYTQASALANMDMKSLQTKLGLSDQVKVVRKAQELVRLSNVHFNSSSFGVVCTPSILAL
jgi:hypothetical protein